MSLTATDIRTTTTDSLETMPLTPTSPTRATLHSPIANNTNNKKEPSSILHHRPCHTDQCHIPETVQNRDVSSDFDNGYSNNGFFDCNICFDTAIYPVLTVCGHLFCWACLSRWMGQQKLNPTCPMCKSGCPNDKIIPVYGRGQEETDPRCDASIPPRPTGQRPEALHDPNVAGSSLFYSFRTNRPMDEYSIFVTESRPALNQYNQSDGFLSRLMLMILSLFIVLIVFY